jgi:hypothetical protein
MNVFNLIFGGKTKADGSEGDVFPQLDDNITAPQDAVEVLLVGMLVATSLVVLLKRDIFPQLDDNTTAPQDAVEVLLVGMSWAMSLVMLLKDKMGVAPSSTVSPASSRARFASSET